MAADCFASSHAFTGAITASRGARGSGGSVLVLRPRAAGTARSPSLPPARCAVLGAAAAPTVAGGGRRAEQLAVPPRMVDELVEEALVWCSQHGLVVGDKNHPVK